MSFEVWLKKLLKTKILYIKSLAFQIFGLLDVNFATKFLCSTGSLNVNKFQQCCELSFWIKLADRRNAFNLISSRDHCQRFSPSWISNTPQAGFEPVQNLSLSLVEWTCAVVLTTTPRRHKCCILYRNQSFVLLSSKTITSSYMKHNTGLKLVKPKPKKHNYTSLLYPHLCKQQTDLANKASKM